MVLFISNTFERGEARGGGGGKGVGAGVLKIDVGGILEGGGDLFNLVKTMVSDLHKEL